jgi:hypothetical protein
MCELLATWAIPSAKTLRLPDWRKLPVDSSTELWAKLGNYCDGGGKLEMVFSASVPPHTSPKSVEPVTRMSPAGTLPDTETSRLGVVGSLLAIVIIPLLGPSVVG